MGLAEFLLESSISFGRNVTPFSNIEGDTFLSFWNKSEKPVKLKNLGVVASGEIQAGEVPDGFPCAPGIHCLGRGDIVA